ncbi:MAG: DUF4838 domain-containing protein [Clostridia bacterium]|nr:DUF4838 domain-containing protein [Clostridia bacterium]
MYEKINFKRKQSLQFTVNYEENVTLAFAADELIRYGERMLGKDGVYEVYLGCSGAFLEAFGVDTAKFVYDGFFIEVTENRIVVASLMPRGVLFGVYEILERNGCVFVRVPSLEEYVPKTGIFRTQLPEYVNSPMEIRSISYCCYEFDGLIEELTAMIDNCAKNKANAFFIHQNMIDITEGIQRAVNEIKKRGMIFEYGGHFVEKFVPRERFEEEPELFIERNGKRVNTGNFCPSNPKSIRYVVDGLVNFVKRNKGIDVLHTWFEDSTGGWCTCEKCKGISPTEQQAIATRAMAKAVKEVEPTLKIDFLLYNETLANTEKLVVDEDNVYGMFAPRGRCYAHGLDECDNNRWHLNSMAQAGKRLSAGMEVFEYYSDICLFMKAKTAFPHTVAKDMQIYLANGANKITDLTFGDYSYWAHDLTTYVFLKHVYDPFADVEKTIERFLSVIGADTVKLKRFYDLVEKYSSLYVAFCGYLKNMSCMVRLQLSEYSLEHMKKIEACFPYIAEAKAILAEILQENDSEFLRSQYALMEITETDIRSFYNLAYTRAYNHFGKIGKEEAKERLKIAKDGLLQNGVRLERLRRYGGSQFQIQPIDHLSNGYAAFTDEVLIKEVGYEVEGLGIDEKLKDLPEFKVEDETV